MQFRTARSAPYDAGVLDARGSAKEEEHSMKRLIDLGRVSEETGGAHFHSVNLDSSPMKRMEFGIKYRSTNIAPNWIKVEDPE